MESPTAEEVVRMAAFESDSKARRRNVQWTMKEIREKLTSDQGLNRAFEYELARLYCKTRMSATPALLAGAICASLTLAIWVPALIAFGWGLMVLGATLLPHALARKFLKLQEDHKELVSWRRRFMIGEGMFAFCWSSITAMVLLNESAALPTFILLALFLLAAAIAVLDSSMPRVAYSGFLPITLAMIVLGKPGMDMDGTVFALMGVFGVAFFALLASRLFEIHCEAIAFRAEKDILIGDLEHANAKSADARLKAEEANIAKSRFLATMSHELRTPLNAILGFSEVLKGEYFGKHTAAQYRDYSNDIHASGQHLLTLINEILDLSRIESGKYDLHEEALSLAAIAEDCGYLLAMRAKAKSQIVHTRFEPEMAKLWGDERAIRQIILNLLSNAVKFTPQNGEIWVTVGWTGSGGQYISVRDNGPGIPENEIAVAMSSFGRGSMAIKTAEQGTGLGLPIVKGLVDLHGGRFTLQSRVRVGTEAIVTFPTSRVMQALAPLGAGQTMPTPTPRRAA
jgi:two-component system, cell cycle sensor histidine kinase PleC